MVSSGEAIKPVDVFIPSTKQLGASVDSPDLDVSAEANEALGGVSTPSCALYKSLLSLDCSPVHAATSIYLPLTERAHLTREQHSFLRKWAGAIQTLQLPNGLLDVAAACPDALLQKSAFAGKLCAEGQSLVESAVYDLRRKMEERNVHSIQNGRCARIAQRMVLQLNISALQDAEEMALSKLGVHLDGLCRAVAEYDCVLGAGGWRLLQRARRALREWFKLHSGDGWGCFDVGGAHRIVVEALPEDLGPQVRSRAATMAVASHDAVRIDLAHDASGLKGERTLEARLVEAGLGRAEYLCEDELREVQEKSFGRVVYATPDVLFRQGVLVNGNPLAYWIDSKGSCLLPGFCFGSQLDKLRNQLTNYVQLFGPGIVAWQGGFATVATDGLQGVRTGAWIGSGHEARAETCMRWQ